MGGVGTSVSVRLVPFNIRLRQVRFAVRAAQYQRAIAVSRPPLSLAPDTADLVPSREVVLDQVDLAQLSPTLDVVPHLRGQGQRLLAGIGDISNNQYSHPL